MSSVKTYTQDKNVLSCTQVIGDRIETHYGSVDSFIERLKAFIRNLEINRERYNINPYSDKVGQGIYILSKNSVELGIFPEVNLALKCSQGKFLAENVSKQFTRSIQLEEEFTKNLTPQEQKLLGICPVYLYFENHESDAIFKQVLFMQRIGSGISLGDTKLGFSDEFCRVFKIPTFEEICLNNRFNWHFLIDKNQHRQLLKIQTAYLFRRLWSKGIKILSLNQKNIMLFNSQGDRYTIIDPTTDYLLPRSPLYNALTAQFCS
jgi:hypothetical protein